MNNIYIIGGSPCSGKSTIANILKEKYKLFYYKVDDYLEEYTTRGAVKGFFVCKQRIGRTSEDIWMREPKIQCYYRRSSFFA